jgi:hypothetical protein
MGNLLVIKTLIFGLYTKAEEIQTEIFSCIANPEFYHSWNLFYHLSSGS